MKIEIAICDFKSRVQVASANRIYQALKSQFVISSWKEATNMDDLYGNTNLVPVMQNNALHTDIKNLIYVIRGQEVMLDVDLAHIYGYEVRVLNQQVKRSIGRFPDDFMFQLTKEEYENLMLNNSTSSYGGRRTMPYVFTEQGIYMLATVLKGEVAEQQSIFIMRAFREMRTFISNNALLFEKVSHIELKQLEYQKSNDDRFDKVFRYIEEHAEAKQKIFFDGQIYDAFSLITSVIQKAESEIILIDGYVDVGTLNILAKKKDGVKVSIFTLPSSKLTKTDISKFNSQYPVLSVKRTKVFHDRFIILDGKTAYLVGSSLKDAGKKCFGITLLEDPEMVTELLNRLKKV